MHRKSSKSLEVPELNQKCDDSCDQFPDGPIDENIVNFVNLFNELVEDLEKAELIEKVEVVKVEKPKRKPRFEKGSPEAIAHMEKLRKAKSDKKLQKE